MNPENRADQYPQLKHVFLIIFLTLCLTFGIGLLGAVIGAKTELFLLEGLLILPALVFTWRSHYSLPEIFRLRPVNKKIAGMSAIIGVAFAIVSDEIDRIIQLFFPMPEIFKNAIEASMKIQSTSDFIIIVFSAVFLAAIVEEMLFRGFVQTSFENHFDITKAVMSTSLVFAVVHFNPWWSIQVLIIGVLLGVMAWKSDSIIPPIIVHFVNNAIALVFANLPPESLSWYSYKNHVSIPILIAAILMTIYGFRLYYHFCDLSTSD